MKEITKSRYELLCLKMRLGVEGMVSVSPPCPYPHYTAKESLDLHGTEFENDYQAQSHNFRGPGT